MLRLIDEEDEEGVLRARLFGRGLAVYAGRKELDGIVCSVDEITSMRGWSLDLMEINRNPNADVGYSSPVLRPRLRIRHVRRLILPASAQTSL